MLQLLYHSLITSWHHFLKFFKNLKETYHFTFLLTALSSSMSTDHEFTMKNCCVIDKADLISFLNSTLNSCTFLSFPH